MEQQGNIPPFPRGRGTRENPPNRFEPIELEWEGDWLEEERLQGHPPPRVPTRCFEDRSRTVLSGNDSPDLGFAYSINPYRGCEHGCVYCYARPSHEYLGFSAGLDFESRIMVKRAAPHLLAQELDAPRWQPQVVAFSGNTDCYQPIEQKFRLTRQCLEVMQSFGNPVEIITKNALITRDLPLLAEMATAGLVRVTLSVTTLDGELARRMEPRASTPSRRLAAIGELARAGVLTRVNVAPIIPGLNDHELPRILEAAAAQGALGAGYTMLRLPWGVKELFCGWLEEVYPARAKKVLAAIRETRSGKLSDSRFVQRMRGEGVRAAAIRTMFETSRKKLGLDRPLPPLRTDGFRRRPPAQQSLF